MATPEKTKLVRDALTKSTRKELQKAAKELGIKANGTNLSMIAQLNEWLARNGTDPRDVPYRGQELAVDPEVEHELSSFKMGQKV